MAGHPEWMHDWPNPMPWARAPSLPENIVRFTASPAVISPSPLSSSGHVSITATHTQPVAAFPHSPHFIPNSQIKRSSSSDEEDDDYEFQRPAKVCATTDRVAAKLGHLNISSSGAPVAAGTSVQIQELEEDDPDSEPEHLIHFSDEMHSVMSHESTDLVSSFLQAELDKSSKAVVLWTPNPLVPVVPIIETVDSDESDEVQDSLSIDSDGLIIEEVVDDDDDDDAQMEIEL
jgi:hypothetical protein